MTAILFDPVMDDATRRRALYEGALILYSPRTVHAGDARARRGAPHVDSACTGTTSSVGAMPGA
jgi:hypothetical protein